MQKPKLTKRETKVIGFMVAGKSNKEIGASLGVTGGTVKVHIGHILKKLGASGRTGAIRIVLARWRPGAVMTDTKGEKSSYSSVALFQCHRPLSSDARFPSVVPLSCPGVEIL
jgi:DNA-binding CsgD family transcriptional regulator